jgi:HAD superfamily hydrolase (TIGR01509 family)
MKSAFIFDMDGTMVDNMHHHTASWVELLGRHGVDIEPSAFFNDTAGRPGQHILRTYLDGSLTEADCALLIDEKEGLYQRRYAAHMRALPGFGEFIGEARRRGVALAVASGAPPTNLDFILDGLGLRGHFDAVVGAADVRHGKPDPEVFELAARLCGVASGRCVVFEDAPLGVEAAARAGMPAVVLTTTLPAQSFAQFGHVLACAPDFRGLSCEALLGGLG